MKHVVLQNAPLNADLERQLGERYELLQLHLQPDAEAFLSTHAARAEALACGSRHGASMALLEKLPNLRVVSSMGAGYDRLDVPYLYGRGIAVAHTPDVLNDCVADTAMGLVITVARRLCTADRFVREGAWMRGAFPLSHRVSGKRLGILGLGRIGKSIAKRAQGFDMDVRYHNRRVATDVPYRYEPRLEKLAEWADFLVVASAGGDASRGLVGEQVLEALGPAGYLVNVARGSIVDEAALGLALRERRIAGAGLDVYQAEPTAATQFAGLDNVVLLPHVGSATIETRQAMAALMLQNLASFFATGSVVCPVPESHAS